MNFYPETSIFSIMKSFTPSVAGHIRSLSVFAGLSLLLLAGLFWFPREAFWITDGGNKFMVMQEFLRSGSVTLTVPASDRAFFPTGEFHFLPWGEGGFRSVFPVFFPVMCSWLFRWFGDVGLYLPSVFGTAAIGWILWHRSMREKEANGCWLLLGIAMAVFATPLAFYSWTFWEMALSVTVATVALVLAMDGRSSGAGVVLGAMLWIRPEGYFLAAALGTALWVREGKVRSAFFLWGTFALTALPLWIWQYWDSGHWLGLHGALYHQHNAVDDESLWRRIGEQLGNYPYYWFSFRGISDSYGAWLQTGLTGVIAAAAAAGIGFGFFRQGRRLKLAIGSTAAVLWAIAGWRLWEEPEPVLSSIFTVGLWSSQPFLLLILLNLRPLWRSRRGMIGLSTVVLIVYAVLVPPLLTSRDLGIIWGPRHFLLLLPVTVWPALYAAQRMRAAGLMVVLLVLSVGIQVCGWRALRMMKENSMRLSTFLQEETGPVVVSDVYFLPMQTPRLFAEKRWLYVSDDHAMAELLRQLRRESCREFSMVVSVSDQYRRVSNPALRKLLEDAEIVRAPVTLSLPGTSFLEMRVFDFRLR